MQLSMKFRIYFLLEVAGFSERPAAALKDSSNPVCEATLYSY